jgi:hypothetical protein
MVKSSRRIFNGWMIASVVVAALLLVSGWVPEQERAAILSLSLRPSGTPVVPQLAANPMQAAVRR